MATEHQQEPQGYSLLYKNIATYPELGLFRRLGAFWSKKLHDDTSKFRTCLFNLNDHLGKVPGLGGKTVLDCPLGIVQAKCPRSHALYAELWDAWDKYDASLLNYGKTLCLSEQIMKLPDQNAFYTKDLCGFELPICKPIFENGTFVPTGEEAEWYQVAPGWMDTCTWRDMPRDDLLTMSFVYSSQWIETQILARLRRCIKRTKPLEWDVVTRVRLHRIVAVMDIFSCCLASILLAITVLILAVVHDMKSRIGIIGGAGTIFALCVRLMSNKPSRGDIFAATAAFYAVAVVFVAATNNDCICF